MIRELTPEDKDNASVVIECLEELLSIPEIHDVAYAQARALVDSLYALYLETPQSAQ